MFPVVGAVVGGAVGGPIGFLAGLKLGSVTGGLAAAGITGTVIGYQVLVSKAAIVVPRTLHDLNFVSSRL